MIDPYLVDNARIKRSRKVHKKIKISYSGYLWIGIKKGSVFTSTTLTQLVKYLKEH